ncbi:hypothetical protein JCM33374_g1558 [Metschnikowia sp. JCM 33374]|nr:hypothetical protein JCM33374_g1558 [Metschnikowia sp. JCM 33374]
MNIEIYPTKRYVFDSNVHVSTKFRPLGQFNSSNEWVPEPGPIGIRTGNYTTVTESIDYRPEHKHLLDAISERVRLSANLDEPVPSSYAEAKKSPKWPLWREACNAELAVLDEVDTYSMLPRTNSINVSSLAEWEFSIEDDGTYRAKLVARIPQNIDGTSYHLNSRPMQRNNLFRLFFAISAQYQLPVTQMKFNSGYFNQAINEYLYVTTPPGLFVSGQKIDNHVLKLKRMLTGFVRAPVGQAQQIAKALRTQGFFQVSSGVPLFHRGANQNFVLIGVFDEDLLIATSNEAKLDNVRNKLIAQFKMRMLLTPRKINGINIIFSNNVTKLHLGDYIDSLLRDYNMENCTPQKIPVGDIDLNIDRTKPEESCTIDEYRSLVAKLAYAAATVRFDIDHIVRELVRYLETPKQKHWQAAKNVVRYLKGTKLEGLTYRSSGTTPKVEGYASAKCGEKIRDLYQASLVKYSGSPIFWRTRFGEEYNESSHSHAIRYATTQVLWTVDTLKDLGFRTDCNVYGDDRQAVLDERLDLPQRKANYFAKGRKRARGNEKSNGSSEPAISIYEMKPMPARILTERLPHSSFSYYYSLFQV